MNKGLLIKFVQAKKGLMIGAKLIFPAILGRIKNGYCEDSNSYFSKQFGVSPQSISNWIQALEKDKIIEIEYIGTPGNLTRRLSSIVDRTYQASLIDLSSMLEQYISITYSNTLIVENDNVVPEKPKPEKKEKKVLPYNEIVEMLNTKSGRDFKPSTKSTQSAINARFREGYTLEDFEKVITIKTADWLNDAKMKKYLRPETLFGTKFESYLNEANEAGVRTSSQVKEENEQVTKHDERFEAYLNWSKKYTPTVTQSVKYLSKKQFADFMEGAYIIRSRARRTTIENELAGLRTAHKRMERNPELIHSYPNVLDFFLETTKKEIAQLERI